MPAKPDNRIVTAADGRLCASGAARSNLVDVLQRMRSLPSEVTALLGDFQTTVATLESALASPAALEVSRFYELVACFEEDGPLFGVLSSHSSYRSRVVPEPPDDTTCHRPAPAVGDQLDLLDEQDDCSSETPRYRWAWMLAHVFRADLESCPKFGGWQGYAPQPPPSPHHAPLGQLASPFDN